MKKNIIIIGAGISGLYLATLLQKQFNVTIIEARHRVGGRILTLDGHDMGPSWIWQHHKQVLGLIQELGLELFPQYTTGLSLYDTQQGVQKFNPPPSAPSARVKGGLSALVEALETKLDSSILHLDERIEMIAQRAECLAVKTSKGEYEADFIISTLPPRLAAEQIKYLPELPQSSSEKLLNISTWMGNSAKCVVEFEEAFWKDEGLSGGTFSHVGPLGEIHDACTSECAALFGFLNAKADTENIEADVRTQMQRLFGSKASLIKKIYFIDWREEKFTSSILDKKPLSAHPDYGFELSHFDNKMFFKGTESADKEGGYLDGAIYAVKKLSKELSKF